MQLSQTGKVLIDPRDYRSFCFRGEGRANFVISAKHRETGVRIVWRFAKARKSGLLTVKARSELVNSYMERIVGPFFDEQYLVNMNIVEFETIDVHQLAKIPSLPANRKIEKFEDLFELPEEYSFLPRNTFQRMHGAAPTTNPKRLTSLQMLDATQIPNAAQLDVYSTSTVTVEIKPKQGFLQDHPNINTPHCNNCILQIEKCGSSHFTEMYDFCPLDIFSGQFSRMRKAIHSLILVPHRNLRVFVDGNLVHSDEKALDQKRFDDVVFERKEAEKEDLVQALCFALSGNQSRKKFKLRRSSVLGQILRAQKIDEIGMIRAHEIYQKLDHSIQGGLLDKTGLSRVGIDEIMSNTMGNGCHLSQKEFQQLQQLRRYFVAATMKDCSIMVSMRVIPSNCTPLPPDIVRLPNGKIFAYSIKIVDLDPKTPKNLLSSFPRFLTGVKLINLEAENAKNGDENARKFEPCKE